MTNKKKNEKRRPSENGKYEVQESKHDLYFDYIKDRKDSRSEDYILIYNMFPSEDEVFSFQSGIPRIEFGSKLCSTVVQFYISMIEEVGFWQAIECIRIGAKSKRELKEKCVEFARSFVDEHEKMIKKLKMIFADMDEIFLEKVVGNLFLLDVDGHTYDEKLAWCLIHYRTTEV